MILVNPNFEDGFSEREASEVVVANGWDYAYLKDNDPRCPDPCMRPEFKPERQITQSGTSQRWFSTFARHFAAIYQYGEVEAGHWYTFGAWGFAVSEPPGQLGIFCGANPWGADVFHRTTIWGKEQPLDSYRRWYFLSVTFQAFGNKVAVALGSNNKFPTHNNTVFWDNAIFYPAEGIQPAPQPEPDPEGSVDYGKIRTIITTAIAEREPVRWP